MRSLATSVRPQQRQDPLFCAGCDLPALICRPNGTAARVHQCSPYGKKGLAPSEDSSHVCAHSEALLRAPRMASWRSGDAADCKSVYTGSIPVLASTISKKFRLCRSHIWGALGPSVSGQLSDKSWRKGRSTEQTGGCQMRSANLWLIKATEHSEMRARVAFLSLWAVPTKYVIGPTAQRHLSKTESLSTAFHTPRPHCDTRRLRGTFGRALIASTLFGSLGRFFRRHGGLCCRGQ